MNIRPPQLSFWRRQQALPANYVLRNVKRLAKCEAMQIDAKVVNLETQLAS